MLNEKHDLDKAHAKESINSKINTFVTMDLAPVSWDGNENRNHERSEYTEAYSHESCFLFGDLVCS